MHRFDDVVAPGDTAELDLSPDKESIEVVAHREMETEKEQTARS